MLHVSPFKCQGKKTHFVEFQSFGDWSCPSATNRNYRITENLYRKWSDLWGMVDTKTCLVGSWSVLSKEYLTKIGWWRLKRFSQHPCYVQSDLSNWFVHIWAILWWKCTNNQCHFMALCMCATMLSVYVKARSRLYNQCYDIAKTLPW